MRKYMFLLTVLCLLASPALADLKITSQVDSTGVASAGDGETVSYIKGMKMRADTGDQSTILDVEKRQMIVLEHKKKRAFIHDLTPVAQQQASVSTSGVSLEPTGETREIAGYTCEVYNMSLTVAASMGGAQGMKMDMSMKGPACLSEKAPGADEAYAFYKAMSEKGLFLGPPEAAQSQPGQQRGMTELYETMAEKGVGLSSKIEVGFEGSGLMAKMMKKMGFTTTTTVTDISEAALSDDLFEVPAGYKVKNR